MTISHKKNICFIFNTEGRWELIYLDHAATTPVHDEVLNNMYKLEKEIFGNPSSIHQFGRKAKYYLDEARKYLADSIHANEKEIIFTSGGTEANNLAIIGTALENEYNGNHIITSAQEHHAILHIMQYLQKLGFHVTYLPVNEKGQINVSDVERTLTDQTILVSVMTANNETGIIQPIQEVANLLKDHQAYFHTDAVQAYSMLDIDVKEMGIDLLTTSGHKLNGPKGIGFLYAAEHVPVRQMQYGGLQEKMKRPGTENLIGAVGYYIAAKMAIENREINTKTYRSYKQKFLQTLTEGEIEYTINGDLDLAIPTIVNISFPGTKVDVMLTNLDLEGVAASSGSACTAGSLEPSHVLKAMYNSRSERINNSIRFSFGSANTLENVEEAANRIVKVIKRLTE